MDSTITESQRSGLKPWKPGQSGNPLGLSRIESDYRNAVKAAIRGQETTDHVCSVVEAMRKMALRGGKTAPAAAKVYLEAVGVKAETNEVIEAEVQRRLQVLLAEAEEMARRKRAAIDVQEAVDAIAR